MTETQEKSPQHVPSYTLVQNWVADLKMSSETKVLYWLLCIHAQQRMVVNLKFLPKMVGLPDVDSVKVCLKKLEKLNAIETKKPWDETNLSYKICSLEASAGSPPVENPQAENPSMDNRI